MKTIGRILIILAVTALITAAMYFAVNASGSGLSSDFRRGREQFQPGGTFPNGARPEGSRPNFEGGRPGREGGEDGPGGLGWTLGWIKDLGVIAVLVAIIVLPKRLGKRKRLAAVKADPGDSA
jgi:hypothetical protein